MKIENKYKNLWAIRECLQEKNNATRIKGGYIDKLLKNGGLVELRI